MELGRPRAREARALVVAWLTAAGPLRRFHELRLHLGVERSDGFNPDRVVFEWKVDGVAPLTSMPPGALSDGSPLGVDVADYPHEALDALRSATGALVEWRNAQALRTEIEIKTRLLPTLTDAAGK